MFKNDFIDSILNKKLSDCVFSYYTSKNKYKYFVFLEGLLDITFYSSFLDKKIKDSYPGDIKYISCGSKNNVIEFINLFYKNHKKIYSNNYHIVDSDYDKLDHYNCVAKDRITLTKYYSLESYAFVEKNMDYILKSIGYDEKNISDFKLYFNQFVCQLLDYETLLYMKVNGIVDVDIDNLSLNESMLSIYNGPCIGYSLKNKVTMIKNNIMKNIYFSSIFKEIKDKFSNNILYIRGHDLELIFNFLNNYFGFKSKLFDILSNKKIIKEIDIELQLR